ncbi:MAG: HAD family phosphatase [Phycisphaerae bacterium]|nr:HAD family phosphatase [Phycisphaerae bacterium]
MQRMGVIFDMDGVLVDSYQPHFISWCRLAAQQGVEMTEAMFATTFGRTSRDIIRHFWAGCVVSDEQIVDWDRRKEQAYRDILAENFPEMDGAAELLSGLHEAGFSLGIGSSGPPENVDVIRRHLRNARWFKAQATGADVTYGKPHPEVFLVAAGKLGIEPRRCLVVEDAPAGVTAGKAAGMAVIAITGTVTRDKLAHADHVVDSLRQITPELVTSLIGHEKRL